MRVLAEDEVARANPGLNRELTTARAYATYIRERHGETFVYASRFRGAFVPVFDGYVIGPDGQSRRNISLKFDSLRRSRPTPAALAKSLGARVNVARDQHATQDLVRWISAVNVWSPVARGWQTVRNLDCELDRALALWVTFGLREGSVARPLTTVVDLRDSGFTYDDVAGMDVPAGLSLLWDHARVLEF